MKYILLFLPLFAQARTFSPISIQAANQLSLAPGDTVYFQPNVTYYGGLIQKPGVVYLVNGSGQATLTGFSTVSSWKNLGGGIYEGDVPNGLSSANVVLVGGVRKPMGRYPNSGYVTISSHTGNTSVTTAANLPTSIVGATIVIRKLHWMIDRNKITSSNSHAVNYTPLPGSGTWQNPQDGWGFFIQNHIKTLDSVGEWYYNPSTKKIAVFFGNTTPTTVKVSTVEDVVTTQGNVTMRGFRIEGANREGVNITASGLIFTNNDVRYAGHNLMAQSAAYNDYSITNNEFRYANNCAIGFWNGGNNHYYKRNYFSDNGTMVGAGDSGDLGQETVIDMGSNVTMQYNRIYRGGYTGIRFSNRSNILIQNNLVDTYCLVKDDGSGIYAWNNGQVKNIASNNVVQGNIILNGIGNYEGTKSTRQEAYGIYMDDGAYNVRVEGNTISNAYFGLINHNGYDIAYLNNTVYNCRAAAAIYWKDKPTIEVKNLTIKNNIYASKGEISTSRFWDINGANSNTIASFGVSDSNYHLTNSARPVVASYGNYNPYDIISLDTWKASVKYGNKDQHSTQVAYKPEVFYYNASTVDTTVTLGKAYKDVRGVAYSDSVTLKPYTSIILLEL
jgi:hypothetical protein